jgi:putative addiction module killer protein
MNAGNIVDEFRGTTGVAGAPVGDGISDLRIHEGAGYRVYFPRRGTMLVILPCGGDKSSQARDTETAKRLARARSGLGNPTPRTTLAVMKALHIDLTAKPAQT